MNLKDSARVPRVTGGKMIKMFGKIARKSSDPIHFNYYYKQFYLTLPVTILGTL